MQLLDIDDIAVDPTLASKGVWTNYMGGEFLLARKGSEYNSRLTELYIENADVIQAKTPESTVKLMEIYQRAFCEKVLLDWKILRGGKKLKYTPETAWEILKDPRFAELTAHLESFSMNHANYREAKIAEVAKQVKSSAVS